MTEPPDDPRLAALQGKLLDDNGNVIADYFDLFGVDAAVEPAGEEEHPPLTLPTLCEMVRGIERAMAMNGQAALVIDVATHSARIVDEAELMIERGGNVIIINSGRCGKSLAAEELFSHLDLTKRAGPTPAAPDYLRHDPSKNHRNRRSRRHQTKGPRA